MSKALDFNTIVLDIIEPMLKSWGYSLVCETEQFNVYKRSKYDIDMPIAIVTHLGDGVAKVSYWGKDDPNPANHLPIVSRARLFLGNQEWEEEFKRILALSATVLETPKHGYKERD